MFADKACEAEFNLEISLEKARPENKSGKVRTNGNSILNIFWLKKLKPYFKSKNLSADWNAIQACDDERLIATLAMICPFSNIEKQAILGAFKGNS